MTIQVLIIKFCDFIALIDDICLLSIFSLQIFEKYPQNIPPHIYQPIANDLEKIPMVVNLYYNNKAKKSELEARKQT